MMTTKVYLTEKDVPDVRLKDAVYRHCAVYGLNTEKYEDMMKATKAVFAEDPALAQEYMDQQDVLALQRQRGVVVGVR